MEYFELIKARHSTRTFTPQPVEKVKLDAILDAANQAPSAGNVQGYEIFLVRKQEQKAALAKAALEQTFMAQAPVVLVFCANPARSSRRYGQRGVRLYSVQDATIACTFAMLAATELGLATVWIGAFDDDAVRQAIHISDALLPVAMLPIGYAGEHPEPTGRRKLEDLVREL